MATKPIKIINKKMKDGQDLYQIHLLGQHRQAAKWLSQQSIINRYPESQQILKDYDKQLKFRCGRLKSRQLSYRRSRDQKQQSEQGNAKEIPSIRKNQPRLYHNNQIFQQAKHQIRQRENNRTISPNDFVLRINTPIKLESNWVFGDHVIKVKSKVKGEAMYGVVWQDGSETTVKEQQLINNDAEPFCRFWEQQLGMRRRNTKENLNNVSRLNIEEGMKEQGLMIDDKQSL